MSNEIADDEKRELLQPCVYWIQPTGDPYDDWVHMQVTIGTMLDPCGCRRKRFRDHCTSYPDRWGMYYEAILDEYEYDQADSRRMRSNDSPTIFIAKLYAKTEGVPLEELNQEFAWMIRPCKEHGKPITDGRKRCFHPPSYMKEEA